MGRDLAIKKVVTHEDSQLTTLEYYAYGSDRIARIDGNSSTADTAIVGTEATFFLYDHLGNNRVAFSLDSSNQVVIVNAMDYFPYGKILREFNNGTGDRYLTTQHERDKETGLDYRGARYYDSDVARFLSLDPLSVKYPAWSTYNYVTGNPIMLIDPDGNKPTDWIKKKGSNTWEWDPNVTSAEQAKTKYGENTSYLPTGSFIMGSIGEGTRGLVYLGFNEAHYAGSQTTAPSGFANPFAGPWYETAGKYNLGVGTGASLMELSSSTFRITNGIANGAKFSPKLYSSGWAGGSRAAISTYKIGPIGRFLGRLSFFGGILMDGAGVYNYNQNPKSESAVHPAKAVLNTGMAAYGLYVNPIPATLYFGVDAFYPGGWKGYAEKTDELIKANQKIIPNWQLMPASLKM